MLTQHENFQLWDYDVPCDDFIGTVNVSVATIVKQQKVEKNFEVFNKSGLPVKNGATRKPTKLRLCLSYDTGNRNYRSRFAQMSNNDSFVL
jgi:hypothetical protein